MQMSLLNTALVACAALALGWWLRCRQLESDTRLSHTRIVARQMAVAENYSAPSGRRQRVAVGLGACVDLYISASDFWPLFPELPAPKEFRHLDALRSVEDLATEFGFYFRQGAAAERYLDNEAVFQEIVRRVLASGSVSRQSLGGNAPFMANRLASDGADVLLGARVPDKYRQQLHPRVQVAGSDQAGDYHVVVEYEVGDRALGATAPRANRFIFHRDRFNPLLSSLRLLQDRMEAFRPDLLVVSGLQLMDGFPYANLSVPEHRMQRLQEFLVSCGRVKVHLELASITDQRLLQLLLQHVVAYSDSIGMNEQELPNLLSMLETGKPIMLADSYPRVATTLDQMRRVYRVLRGTSAMNGRRKVTRLHLHTIGFQAVMVTHRSGWPNAKAAAARAALMAHRFTCGVAEVDLQRTKMLMDDSFAKSAKPNAERVTFNASEPVSCWSEEPDFDLCVAPGLVCTRVQQTAGAGDNISAAGLLPQILPLDGDA